MRTDDFWPALGASVPDILMSLDADGTILFMNRPPAGMTADEVVGTSVFDLVPAASRAQVWAALQEVFTLAEARAMELAITRPSGPARWILANAGPYRDARQVVAATVLVRDITATKATEFALHHVERQLQQVQKLDMLGQLATGMMHDFANLLVIIRASLDVLLPALPPHSEERDAAMAIWTATDRGQELTRQIMAFVRANGPSLETVDLNAVVESVCGMLGRLLGPEIRLQKRLHVGAAQVLAERGQIEQVLANLMVNARDAMTKGGTITVATRVDVQRNEVVLSVIDTGSGMDDVTQRRVFEPFFTTKAPGRGTGLGLSTVAMIVELLGGRIVVKSRVDVGTTIDVILPRARSESSP